MKYIYKITLILLCTTNLDNKINASDNVTPVIKWCDPQKEEEEEEEEEEEPRNLIFGIPFWQMHKRLNPHTNTNNIIPGYLYICIGAMQITNGCFNTAIGCCILTTQCCCKLNRRA